MFWRFMGVVLSLLGGALIGVRLGVSWGMAAGVALVAVAWFAWGFGRAERVLQWLRAGAPEPAPALGGLWGEAADRVRRLRRQQQTRVDDAEERLQDMLQALQASPNGVIFLDPEGRIEWCNQIAAGQFGIDVERDLLQSIGNLVRNPDFSAYYASGQEGGIGVVIAGRQSTANRPVRLSVQLHEYGQGRKLLLSRDVTALEQAEAMRRDFVANVSHEIRTPLTVLAGFVETLQTLVLEPAEQNRYLGLMAQQAARMQNVVQGLLTLSRLEGSPQPGLTDWTPVGDLLQQCEVEGQALSLLLAPSPSRCHTLHFPHASALDVGEVAGAAGELQSALSNLVSNAVRYTPHGGRITVDWQWQKDGSAILTVADSGPGIDPLHIARLTERFYRVDRSRSRDTGGTGLGLSIVKHVLQRHGATLHIDSVMGKGSVFAAHFPAQRVRRASAAETLTALAEAPLLDG